MKLSFWTIIFAYLIVVSCNKSSLTEGFVPESNVVILDTPLIIKNNFSTNYQFLYYLKKISPDAEITFKFYSGIANTTSLAQSPILMTDSFVLVQCVGSVAISQNSYISAIAHSKGQEMDTSKINIGLICLAAFYKHKPYASNAYSSSNSFYGGAYKPTFIRNQESYLAFKYIDQSLNKIYYGWILLQCNEATIIIKAYGYQTFEPPIIGS